MKKRPTLEEHQKAGIKVKALYEMIIDLSVSMGNSYPNSHPINKILKRMYADAHELKNQADEAVFKEHGTADNMQEDRWMCKIYYGGMPTDWQSKNIDPVIQEIVDKIRRDEPSEDDE